MVIEQGPSFDPKSFLAKVGEGRSISKYHKDRTMQERFREEGAAGLWRDKGAAVAHPAA